MPHLFTCPHCQSKTQVDDRYSGQSGECVTCGGRIQLPNFAVGSNQDSQSKTISTKALGWIIGAVVSLILVGSLLFALVRVGGDTMTQLTENRERSSSKRNLEKIADALNAYASDNGTYPPPMTVDGNNKPLHSWRVLILPYLGEEDLYNRFDLKKPWDDPQNLSIAFEVPLAYQHPNGSSNGMYYQSGYFMITGQGTLFPKNGPLRPDQVTDNPSQTILVTEGTPVVPSSYWTEPVDLDNAKIQGNISNSNGFEPGGLIEGGLMMATTDGRGHFVPNSVDPAVFRALVTPQGGERLPDDTLD